MATFANPADAVAFVPMKITVHSTGQESTSRALAMSSDTAINSLTLRFIDDFNRRAIIAYSYIYENDDIDAVALLSIPRSIDRWRIGVSRGVFEQKVLDQELQKTSVDERPFRDVSEILSVSWEFGGLRIVVSDFEIEEGSLRSFVNGWIIVPVGAIALALAPIPSGQWYQDYRANAEISHVIEGTRCHTEIGFTIDVDDLRRLSLEQLQQTDGSTESIRERRRVCTLQYSLRVLGFSPGKLDGIMGSRTIGALEAFRDAHRPDVSDPASDIILDTILQKLSDKFA